MCIVQVSNAIVVRFTEQTVSIYTTDLTVLRNNAVKPLLAGPISVTLGGLAIHAGAARIVWSIPDFKQIG